VFLILSGSVIEFLLIPRQMPGIIIGPLEKNLRPVGDNDPGRIERIAIACTGRLTGSVPRAVASGLQAKPRSLAVLIRTVISDRKEEREKKFWKV
jgi:hypothetical protein